MKLVNIIKFALVLYLVAFTNAQVSSRIFGVSSKSSGSLYRQLIDMYSIAYSDASFDFEDLPIDVLLTQVDFIDYVGLDRCISRFYEDIFNLVQFPLAGQAIVMVYNLPELAGLNTRIVLDRQTLGKIWTGEITKWNHNDILALNPDLVGILPDRDIIIGYNDDGNVSVSGIFQSALSSFYDKFATDFANAGNLFRNMSFANESRCVNIGPSGAERFDWIKNTTYGLTFVSYSNAYNNTDPNISVMIMYNKAGFLVQPSVESVQYAMADYQEEYASGNFALDIFDAPGNNSWPLSYVNYVVMSKRFYQLDCSRADIVLKFIAWVYTNTAVGKALTQNQYYPLDTTLKKVAIDNIYIVKCNNVSVSNQQYLISFGGSTSIIPSWLTEFTSGSTIAKYYSTLSSSSIELLKSQACDFAVTINGVDDHFNKEMPDLTQMPLAAFAVVPAYNVPEILGKKLVLDIDIITKIYLGQIVNWNNSRIRELNPDISHLLPNAIIQVTMQNISSDINHIFTNFLSQNSDLFNNSIGPTYNPVQLINNTNIISVNNIDGLGDALINNKYSFGFWTDFGIRLLSRVETVQMVSLRIDNNVIDPTFETLKSKIDSDFTSSEFYNPVKRQVANNWPITTLISVVYLENSMNNKDKASALAEFMYWTQFNPLAINSAKNKGYYLASSNPELKSTILNLLKTFNFEGQSVSSYANCIYEGTICSDLGTCNNNSCICNSGRTGQYCEQIISESGDKIVTIVLATIIPFAFIVCLMIIIFTVVIVVLLRFRRQVDDEWEIDFDEIELGESLGTGGFGTVYKATWKGTEVAVKVISSESTTKNMEQVFNDEIRIMTKLRHPNVVLFMAACTKPPKMCIIMENMSLGSMYELLENELIPEIPLELKVKMAYQASKGMHFLHSSGIVHRDLKSLNLLLDSKWNVKVSDFGLTKFRSELAKNKSIEQLITTIHWTAPEILNDSPEIDFALADIYSFGIIMWELMTRKKPYENMSNAAIAVAVIRDNLRPLVTEEDKQKHPAEFIELMTSCWHIDPIIRPTFIEIMTRLSTIIGDSSIITSNTSSSINSSDNVKSGNSKSSHTTSSSTRSEMELTNNKIHVPHPVGQIVVVFTDIISAAKLWEFDPNAMRDATILHNQTIREIVTKYSGYESLSPKDRNSGEGSFCLIFTSIGDAIRCCEEIQETLLTLDWPKILLESDLACEEFDNQDQLLFRGLRVRMGIHFGTAKIVQDPLTKKYQYSGPVVNITAKITTLAQGGQLIISEDVYRNLVDKAKATKIGHTSVQELPQDLVLYEVKMTNLANRYFGGISYESSERDSENIVSESNVSDRSTRDMMDFVEKQDTFLTTANMCRWVIDYKEIQIGKQIGQGSYGTVYSGKWKGVEVAVKKFVKQKLSEKQMLDFRAEVALLSELSHPNIVVFIGACLMKPDICIITEYMKNGSLRDVLKNNQNRLGFSKKIKMLLDAANGINYLHTSQPIIVHRDIKPMNILVDENYNARVADFGFARIKADNTTMTRCGTPCWTAPEIIRGEKYDEKADVFSFGIVMWEVLTGKEPFAGHNFMKVSLDILEGARPQIPSDCPVDFKKLIKKCWHSSASKRPSMEEVIHELQIISGFFKDQV
ncbi:putative serine/threonine protein kinase receptor [Moumouvirus australiensis]|uniref:non-specific serine/threonine protein kinase n=1 Tax=Moumouvirus australiensis TaxID=2109587 RepID=A0A2P1EMR8_9VIRU|nr:putative serine/threonine protein kinase receptor [Moumouvirus australiensis]AVL95162.1 putative serine/threonine protein kinase receptor [Moumouvirus australiensis]